MSIFYLIFVAQQIDQCFEHDSTIPGYQEMEASACSCLTLSPVHEAKEPKSPQRRLDGTATEESGPTKIDGSTISKGTASKLKKRTLFQEDDNEEETIQVSVKAVGDTD